MTKGIKYHIAFSLQRRCLLIRKAYRFVDCAVVSLIAKCWRINHCEIRLLNQFDLRGVIIIIIIDHTWSEQDVIHRNVLGDIAVGVKVWIVFLIVILMMVNLIFATLIAIKSKKSALCLDHTEMLLQDWIV